MVPLTLVDRIVDLDLKAKKITVSRKLEGRHEIVEAKLPALLTVLREMNKPRYPSVPMRLEAQDLPVTLWDNKVLNLDVNQIGLKGSPTAVRKIFSPEREQGEIIGDGAGDPVGTAKVLVEKLVQKELLAL
ncbi:MAG: Acryloyl-CoA reductase electron transfer subunit gamma [Deltaproteobacteria bacterium ADurb.Bin072]|nr:MAG: Acryloyl-CoA reductase electron transfer subunit gamma [Deltaproteobacteria bacterium ADurb.Bin072]